VSTPKLVDGEGVKGIQQRAILPPDSPLPEESREADVAKKLGEDYPPRVLNLADIKDRVGAKEVGRR
jgi:hypothetical protein